MVAATAGRVVGDRGRQGTQLRRSVSRGTRPRASDRSRPPPRPGGAPGETGAGRAGAHRGPTGAHHGVRLRPHRPFGCRSERLANVSLVRTATPGRLKRLVPLAALVALAAGLGGCTLPTFGAFRGATTQGQAEFKLWSWMTIAGLAVAVLVWGLIFWAVVAYRRRDHDAHTEAIPRESRGRGHLHRDTAHHGRRHLLLHGDRPRTRSTPCPPTRRSRSR